MRPCRRPATRRRALVVVLAVQVVAVMAVVWSTTGSTGKVRPQGHFDAGWPRWAERVLHSCVQWLRNATLVEHDEPQQKESDHGTIVFLHIPRTAGDSAATHMFPSAQSWQDPDGTWWGQRGFPHFLDAINASQQLQWENHAPLYRGFISGDDLRWLRQHAWKDAWDAGKVRVFTILRHPVERLLSVRRHFAWLDPFCRTSWTGLASRVRHGHTRYANKYASFMDNSMAYQLGNQFDASRRSVAPQVAAQRACDFLRTHVDFVGFFEDWDTDGHRLVDEVLSEWYASARPPRSLLAAAASWLRLRLFFVGTWVAAARMRTLKYSAGVAATDWAAVRAWTQYDEQVYRCAHDLRHKPLPNLHDSYSHFWLHEALPAAAVALLQVAVAALVVAGCHRRSKACQRCTQRCQRYCCCCSCCCCCLRTVRGRGQSITPAQRLHAV